MVYFLRSMAKPSHIRTLLAVGICAAVLALMALEIKGPEAHEAVRAAQAVLGPGATVEELIRAAFKAGPR